MGIAVSWGQREEGIGIGPEEPGGDGPGQHIRMEMLEK